MKPLGKIFIILAIFAIVMGVTYVIVNAGGTSSNGFPQFENGERPQFMDGERPQFEPGEQPEFPGGEFEGRREGGDRDSGGWMFGLIKNVGIVAVVVALIAVPRAIMQNKKRTMTVTAE